MGFLGVFFVFPKKSLKCLKKFWGISENKKKRTKRFKKKTKKNSFFPPPFPLFCLPPSSSLLSPPHHLLGWGGDSGLPWPGGGAQNSTFPLPQGPQRCFKGLGRQDPPLTKIREESPGFLPFPISLP